MKLRDRTTIVLVSVSTLLSACAMGMLLYAVLVDYFSTGIGWEVIFRYCKRVLLIGAAALMVTVVGALLARPWDEHNGPM